MMADFPAALAVVLAHEGVYAHDPADRGGETCFGIARQRHPDWGGWAIVDRLKSQTPSEGLSAALAADLTLATAVHDFYVQTFWHPAFSTVPQPIATKIMDLTVNLGLQRGIRLVQQALNELGSHVVEDGLIGPQTVQALRLADTDRLLVAIRARLVLRYVAIVTEQPDQQQYLRGWVRRAVAAVAVAVTLVTPGFASVPPRLEVDDRPPASCLGGERGYWQVYRSAQTGRVSLALTTVDRMDPTTVICWVPARARVEAMPAFEVDDRSRRLSGPQGGSDDGHVTRP